MPPVPTGQQEQLPPVPPEFAAGAKVFQTSGCFKCHTLGGGGTQVAGGFPGGPAGPGGPGGPGGPPPGGFGPGGKGGPGGPGGFGPGGRGGFGPGGPGMMKKVDLAHVGKEHDVQWIEQHIRNPKSQEPRSRMPRFDENRINAQDLRALAEYLASLK
jgi:hypothetical protein